MEQKDNKMKRNIIYAIIFVVVLIIIGIIIAYAYYNVDTVLKNTPTNINGTTDCLEIVFKDVTDKNALKLEYNYPISDEWAMGKTDGKENLTPVEVEIINNCKNIQEGISYTLAITTLGNDPIIENKVVKDKGDIPDNKVRLNVKKSIASSQMYEFKASDYLSTLKEIKENNTNYNLISEELTKKGIRITSYDWVNSYEIDTNVVESNSKNTYKIYLWIDYYEGDKEAYEGKEHNKEYDNTTENQDFNSMITLLVNTTDKKLNDAQKLIKEKTGTDGLSTTILGGMYRYQGQSSDIDSKGKELVKNYICFGTTSTSKCLEESNKYLYRIIGITPEGEMKLIKKEALSTMKWYDNYDDDIEWPKSNIYKSINGTGFLENETYVPTNDNGVNWKTKIINKKWHYGDMPSNSRLGAKQNGIGLYETEIGQNETQWRQYQPVGSSGPGITCGKTTGLTNNVDICYSIQDGYWTKIIDSKISLMYLHDYYLSVSKDANCQYENNNYDICKTGWIHLKQNDSNKSDGEWTMSRYGWNLMYGMFFAFRLDPSGYCAIINLANTYSVRPVFYLSSDITIKEGTDGSIGNPYIIE